MSNNGKAQTYAKFKTRLNEPTVVGVGTVITSWGGGWEVLIWEGMKERGAANALNVF